MARTPSTMSPLGTPCPDFDLADPRGSRSGRDAAMGEHGRSWVFREQDAQHVADLYEQLYSG